MDLNPFSRCRHPFMEAQKGRPSNAASVVWNALLTVSGPRSALRSTPCGTQTCGHPAAHPAWMTCEGLALQALLSGPMQTKDSSWFTDWSQNMRPKQTTRKTSQTCSALPRWWWWWWPGPEQPVTLVFLLDVSLWFIFSIILNSSGLKVNNSSPYSALSYKSNGFFHLMCLLI